MFGKKKSWMKLLLGAYIIKKLNIPKTIATVAMGTAATAGVVAAMRSQKNKKRSRFLARMA